jgi:type 1 glutamine amidotransferase/HEAT repeat protein
MNPASSFSTTLALALALTAGAPAALAQTAAPATAAAPNRAIPDVNPEHAAQVDAALPRQARVQPAAPRLVLVTARTEGFYHQSIPVGLYALRQLGERTGAFRVEIDHEMSAFTADNLRRFDAIVFLSTTRLAFADHAARQALLDFVASGKGVVGIHAASDNFYDWAEGQALIGGVFHSHPWNAGDTVAVKLDEPSHPINAAFEGRGFWIKDEIYQIVGPYSRERQRVLMSLDMSKRDNDRSAEKLVRPDKDFPIGWVKNEGRGRVFYSSLGHNDEVFWTTAVLQHYLDGIQFALGDLAAPAAPSASLKPAPVPALAPVIKRTLLDEQAGRRDIAEAFTPANLDAVAAYTTAEDHAPLLRVSRALRTPDARQRAMYEQVLLELARRPNITPDATAAIIDWLGAIGSPTSVAQLRKYATTTTTADAALRALALIPGPAADRALLDLLTTAPEPFRISVIDALGQRRVAAATPALKGELQAEDTSIAAAAGDALSRIASRDALTALREWNASPRLAQGRTWALLHAAQVIEQDGDRRRALGLVRDLTTRSDLPPFQQVAVAEALLRLDARRGLADTRGLLAAPFVGPRLARPWLTAALSSRHPARALAPLTESFAQLPAATQEALLVHAAQSGAPALTPLVQTAVAHTSGALRATAFDALAACGDLSTADALIAALGEPADRAAAVAALGRQTTPGLEARLRNAVAGAPPEVHAALLEILARRLDRGAMPLLLEAAAGTERAPRAAAFRGLAALATGDDLPLILSLRPQLQAADRRLWQEALRASVRGRNDVPETLALLRREIDAASTSERAAFLHAVAGFDDPAALAAIRELLQAPDVERRKEMIRALSSARNENAYTVLIEVAEKGGDETERLLALRGYLDTLAQRRDRWSETIRSYGRAYRIAERDEEREAILAALAGYQGSEAERLITELRALQHPVSASYPQ